MRLLLFIVIVAGSAPQMTAARTEFVFPTPSTAWTTGRIADFVQPTVSGDPESGLFGCVRTGGSQFHEGLDIRPTARDRQGEATDPIFAAMDGIVRHVSLSPGKSSYGRYIVIEHPEQSPAVYTLYAHLARAEPGIAPGVRVRRGQTIATMGRSAGGYAIPKDRAHLHFEIGVRLTEDFQPWYDWRKFGSRNEHGAYNGMNLLGINPLDFMSQWRARRVDDFAQYFARMQPAVTVRIATTRIPDYVRRYPALLRQPVTGLVGGWEISCNATGVPFAWTPLSPSEVRDFRPGEIRVVQVDNDLVRTTRCRQLVRPRRGGHDPGSDLLTVLQLAVGVR